MRLVHAYTDGACSGNPGPGGWGVVLTTLRIDSSFVTRHISGYISDTTNNRMEITAAIEVFKALKTACDVKLFSDSQYLINTMTKGWARNKNTDLWQELDEVIKPHEVRWEWVKGHASTSGNRVADLLATEAIRNRKGKDYRI